MLSIPNHMVAQDYELNWTTVNNGVGTGSDGHFQLMATVGQSDTGASADTSGVYQLEAGFWPAGLTAPPSLLSPLPEIIANIGETVVFEAPIVGTAPFQFQWRLNGLDLIGQTNASLTLTNVHLEHSGHYTVGILNQDGFIESDPGSLTFVVPEQRAEDNFADRVSLSLDSPVITTNNFNATRESHEPLHAGKLSGASVWYSWSTNAGGIATFATIGSDFDTLLAVYTGDSLATLQPVAADDDRGGFLTSQVRFNVEPGEVYSIAIDGLGARKGRFVLSWSFEETTERLPVIASQPAGRAIARGDTTTLAVTSNDAGLTYQWYFNGDPIPLQTSATLTILNAQKSDLGYYTVTLTNPDGRTVETLPASLEFGGVSGVITYRKLEDLLVATGLAGGGGGGSAADLGKPDALGQAHLASGSSPGTFYPASLGSASVHEFSTDDFVKGQCAECGVLSGNTRYFQVSIEQTGLLSVSTLGSVSADGAPLETVLAVHDVGNLSSFLEIDPCFSLLGTCDNGSGPEGSSFLRVPVQAGMIVAIAVGATSAQEGNTLVAEWNLCPYPSPFQYIGQAIFLTGPTNFNPYPQNVGAVYDWYKDGTPFAKTSIPQLLLSGGLDTAASFTMETYLELATATSVSFVNQVTDFGTLVSIEQQLIHAPPGAGPSSFRMILKGLDPETSFAVEAMMDPLTNCAERYAWQELPEASYESSFMNGALVLDFPIDQHSRIYRLRPLPPAPTTASSP